SVRIMARPLDDEGSYDVDGKASRGHGQHFTVDLPQGRPSRKLMFVAHHSWSRTMPGALSGLIPACHTPFYRGGGLELSVVTRQAELCRESGMTAVFVAGATGEWSSLTYQERMALCDRWTETAGSDLSIAVHVGHNCQAEA